MDSSDTDIACLFVNIISECDKWGRTVEEVLAMRDDPVDVVVVNGIMDKQEHFTFTYLFTIATAMQNFNPRVLVATVATNTGINQEDLVHM